MPKKSVREMSFLERMRYSLGAKTFHAVLLLSLAISLAAVAFGFFLYSASVNRQYRIMTYNFAKSATRALDFQEMLKESGKVVSIYKQMSDEEQMADDTDEYKAKFEEIRTSRFESLRMELHKLAEENGAIASYIAAVDVEKNRMVFVVDGDQREDHFCAPGTWDNLKPNQTDAFVNGAKVGHLDKMYGVESMPAICDEIESYGYRCTAGAKVFDVGGFPVFVFFDSDMNRVADVSKTFLWQYCLLLLLVGILGAVLMTLYLKRGVVKPINQLAEAAMAYSRDKLLDRDSGNHFEALDIRTGDELEQLSMTMKDMEADIANYVTNLTRATAEKERMNTELNVASSIQEGMIPHIFPPFPEHREFDIHALMDTAKEVGGDFYDYFLIDEDHLGIVMADVSGKGIPAALFMMASMIMIQNVAKSGLSSPAEILMRVNDNICASNAQEMFVTVWFGILEIDSGKLTASNAGHEYPALMHDGVFSLFKDKHGFVIGGMAGMPYTDYEIQLSPGDKLFQYTDGVTEATNAELELFGTDRMIDTLNELREKKTNEIILGMHKAVDDFVGEAPQFDDITMLCLEYKGNKNTQGKEDA